MLFIKKPFAELQTMLNTWTVVLQTLTGNVDSDSVVKREVQTFTAKMIRFKPQAWSGRITMRVEVFGCLAGNTLAAQTGIYI